MFNDLKGKRVLITGSTAGIGLATAKAYLEAGAIVGINSSSKNERASAAIAELEGLGRFQYYAADLTKSSECEQLVAEFIADFGGMDVLVNNAGGLGGRCKMDDMNDDFYDHVMDLNARSVLMVTKYAIPHLRASAAASGKTAAVISTGSIAGREGGGMGAALYAGSKAWLHNVNRNWVKELTADGIRFNVVAPGTIDTAFHDDKDDALKATIANSIAMKRFGTCEEMAPTYLFLSSHSMSGYITGQIIDVNGGQLAPWSWK